MAHALERRLDRIEARLRAVENALDREAIARYRPVASVPAPQPSVPPPPPLPQVLPPRTDAPRPTLPASRPVAAPAAAPAAARRTPAEPMDWERFFGLAVLGRVGVGAVLLAAGYFAQLAYREMSDVGRVLSIYGLAAAFVGAGWLLRPRVAPRYVALLWGGGAAAAYLAAAVARLRYGLVGDPMGLVLLFCACVLGQVLARKLRDVTLASVALAGAFAAPLLTESTLAAPTFVLVYLLALHTWSAWVERRWGWWSARAVGIAGTVLVACIWVARHGALDTTTYLHVHLYLLGLLAPELVRVFRAERLASLHQSLAIAALGTVEAILLLPTLQAWHPGGIALPWTALLAGTLWTGLAVGLAVRARRAGNLPLNRGLAHIGGVLFALGAYACSHALAPGAAIEPVTLAVWATTGAAVLLLALRRRLGVGEAGAALAVSLAALALVSHRDATRVFQLLPVALAGAAWLTWTARFRAIRSIGAWVGLMAVVLGIAQGQAWARNPDWLAAGLAAGALWSTGVLEFARHRRDPVLAWSGAVQFLLVGALWLLFAFVGKLAPLATPLAGTTTLVGVAIAGFAALSAWRRSRTPPPRDARLQALLWIVPGVLLLAIGHRETVHAVRDLSQAARDGWHTLYLAAAAVLLGWIARGRPVGVGRAALLVLGLALTKVFADQTTILVSPWAAAQILAVLATAVGLAWLADREDRVQVQLAAIGYVVGALCWVVHVAAGRLPFEPALLNLRFLVGVLAAGGAAALPLARLPKDERKVMATVFLLGGLVLGFCVGLVELRERVLGLDGAWPYVLVSVYMTLYAAVVLLVGFLRSDKRLRYPALGLFGIVVLKVGLHDLAGASTGLRILVTGILGLVLLAAAFGYARRGGGPGGRPLEGAEPETPPPATP